MEISKWKKAQKTSFSVKDFRFCQQFYGNLFLKEKNQSAYDEMARKMGKVVELEIFFGTYVLKFHKFCFNTE